MVALVAIPATFSFGDLFMQEGSGEVGQYPTHQRYRKTEAPEMGHGERTRHDVAHLAGNDSRPPNDGLIRFAARHASLFQDT